MTTDEPKAQKPDSPVQIRLWDAVVSITCNADGDIELRSERSDVVGILDHYIHEKLLLRGRTRSDALRVALQIAKEFKEFGAKVVDLKSVRASIRNGWVRLLKANLMGDPAQSYGQRMHEFYTWRGLVVTIEAGSHHVLHTGGPIYWACFDLGDPKYLIVQPSNKKRWRARWERLTRVSFAYFEAPSDWLARCLTAQTTGQKAPGCFERKVAELKAEAEKLTADPQAQLRQGLEGEGDRKQ